jgi:hypothetical protein
MTRTRRPHPTSDRFRLLRLQKRIFHLLKNEADELLGETPEPIRLYERKFQRDFTRLSKARLTPKDELLHAIRDSDVTFISDFHAFRQAQRTAIRVLRNAVKKGENWLIGLEMVASHHQKALDDFQAGLFTVDQFHQIVGYNENWGFPWENYAPIFDWARDNGIRLIALNRPRELMRRPPKNGGSRRLWITDESELHVRDEWAAGIITDLFHQELVLQKEATPKKERSQRLKMIVLYGELHVATPHLPRQLTRISKLFLPRPLKPLVIHQNHDGLYWNLARRHREFHAEIIRLAKNVYCVFSGTPWTKLQSLIAWAEGNDDFNDYDTDEDDELVETETDYLSLMRHYSDAIAEFMGVTPPPYDTMEVVTIGNAHLIDSALNHSELTREEKKTVKFLMRNNHRILIPKADIAYLGTPSHNSAAELAAVRLYRKLTRVDTLTLEDQEDFFRLVLEAAFGFFGSLIINPRRKCDFQEDHRRRLKLLANGTAEIFPMEKEARILALAILRKKTKIFNVPALQELLAKKETRPAVTVAARYIGQFLGRKIHHAVMEGAANVALLQRLCAPYIKRNGGETPLRSFEERYLECLSMTSDTAKATPLPTNL